jgi:hypothetical protein
MGVYFAPAALAICSGDLRAAPRRIRVRPMPWSMPHRVLQVVAALLVLTALSAFAMGIVNAPQRGRMPGEKAAGSTGAAPIEATDATPLVQDRIEGLAPRELTPEEKEKAQAEKEAREEAADAAKAAAATAPPGVTPAPGAPSTAPPPSDKPAAATPPIAPSPDEAPH